MPTYSNPGVYVSESPLANNVQRANNAQSVATFIGSATRGPVTATMINSWSTYKALYGDVTTDHEMGYSVYHYFANGGRDAYIVRVTKSTGAGEYASNSGASVPYYPNGSGQASAGLLDVVSSSPGEWGNNISVKVTAGVVTATSSVTPTFNLFVYLNGAEVERWGEVSVSAANNRYIETVINTYSKYIQVTVPSSVAASADWDFYTSPVSLSAGSDGDALENSDYVAALSALDVVENNLLINVPGQTNSVVVNATIAKAEARANSFVIIDPTPYTDISTIGAGTVNSYTSSSYAAVYYPMLKMTDPTKSGPAAIRNTYPGGAVAGAYVRSEVARTVAKAPAGYSLDIRNALGLVGSFTETDTATLYDTYGVNMFKAVPGAGIYINGARTLDKLSPGKYIPIRRSLNYIKQSLKDSTSFAVFEPNDTRLWTRLSMTVSSFLSDFWRAGGLKGVNSSEAFYVICDQTNNTVTSINNGEVHVEVGVALQYPAEFVVINISQWTGGSNTASTL
jgi:phage tail sheath protein FI